MPGMRHEDRLPLEQSFLMAGSSVWCHEKSLRDRPDMPVIGAAGAAENLEDEAPMQVGRGFGERFRGLGLETVAAF